ncbi:MAG: sulfite exporter TauE/SafE family protein [Bacteriovoracaceae bacterium]|nr:sulfite exporter TauE/SafE family protein [Bacteriovoracaceae bacterium]
MSFLIIGSIVGIVMGLTGAGGALISIPLSMTLLDLTVKEATVLSLVVVVIGALLNLLANKEKPNIKLSGSFLLFGSLGSWASKSLKDMMPDLGVTIMLIIIALYSLWSIWKRSKNGKSSQVDVKVYKTIITGVLLGVVTTLTGLGGGVLLVPILMSIFGFTYNKAVPTSLLAIILISTSSLILQWEKASAVVALSEVGYMAIGVLISAILLRILLKRISPDKTELTRKVVFSVITTYSIGSLISTSL